jgi:uncharacterized protein
MLCAVILVTTTGGRVGAQPDPAPRHPATFFRIGTGAANGTYFLIGGLIANVISAPPGSRSCAAGGSCGVQNLVAVAQSTPGSAANLRAVHTHGTESALAQGDLAYYAFNGIENFQNDAPLQDLRVIANLYPDTVHVIVSGNSPVQSVADLRGRVVALGEEGSGSAATARILLAAHGLSRGSYSTRMLRPAEAAEALAAGRIDAFFLVGGYPVPLVKDLATRTPIRLLGISEQAALTLSARYNFLTPTTIPARTYSDQGRIRTVELPVQWVVSADARPDLVYGLTQALWHPTSAKILAQGHLQGARMQLSHAVRVVTIPLHPGAEQFYREQGLMMPEPVQ